MSIQLTDGQEFFIPKGEEGYSLKKGENVTAQVELEVTSEDENGCTVMVKSIELPESEEMEPMETPSNSGDAFRNLVREKGANY